MAIKGRQERQAPTMEPRLEWADRGYNADARKLDMLPDASVHRCHQPALLRGQGDRKEG